MDQGAWMEVEEPEGLARVRATAARCGSLHESLRACFDGADASDQLELYGRTALARQLVVATPVEDDVSDPLDLTDRELCHGYGAEVDAAVRSSATVEDSADASFAGQCESDLNVSGFEEVPLRWKGCCASLFTERPFSYQSAEDMDPLAASLPVVVMRMVRSDLASSGVMFTQDPDSGHRGVIHISFSYGLGEPVVQGSVSADQSAIWKEALRRGDSAIVHRHLGAKDQAMAHSTQGGTRTERNDTSSGRRRQRSLSQGRIRELGRMAGAIEEHYGQPLDIEWAKNGRSQDLFIVQARPETVHSEAPPPRSSGTPFRRGWRPGWPSAPRSSSTVRPWGPASAPAASGAPRTTGRSSCANAPSVSGSPRVSDSRTSSSPR